MGKLIAFQFSLLQSDAMQASELVGVRGAESLMNVTHEPLPEVVREMAAQPDSTPFVLGRKQCLEFAVGSIAAVLGPEYAPIDRFPTRVRLPAEPLLLVDRILTIEGQPLSLQEGRVVTEHVVRPDAWYLDASKVPACIAIEAGQADLFLSAYLGADFVTKGRAVYRLLDATVTFHRGLPGAGDIIRYDIRITRFFHQGDTILFRFQFDATVRGEPLLSMRDGCAGFFSAEELAAGKGIVASKRTIGKPIASPAESLGELIPSTPTQLDASQVNALRTGDLLAAFGPPFDRMAAIEVDRLPAGRMALLHRVTLLDPTGGPHRRGLIRAEADIQVGDWFLECHFVDDRVMPGTLMFECCLHALRILLMRIGWVGPRELVAFEPAIGVANRLRCRGQVIESTRVVTYEVSIKELRLEPQPIAVADAIIFADGKPIVEISDMAVRLSGTDRQGLEKLWGIPPAESDPEMIKGDSDREAGSLPNSFTREARPLTPDPSPLRGEGADSTELAEVRRAGEGDRAEAHANVANARRADDAGRRPALFDRDRILEFAVGKPSAAFGDRYRPFDEGRFIARLPAPPFQFIDRIMRIDAQSWVMAAGSAAVAEYDINADAWYFDATRQESVPHTVLLEAALQACGWLAAYMGSALHSEDDLKFRILGGRASKHRSVMRQTGTLSTRVKATKISKTAGMILQQYEYSIHSGEGMVYDGIADLGFFQVSSLDQPGSIRDLALDPADRTVERQGRSFAYPNDAPFPGQAWRLVDEIDVLELDGAPDGLGTVRGSARIDPDSWLFKAHFLGDPVWPGSLGQESLLQLLLVAAAERWGAKHLTRFEAPGLGVAHHWTYRGQITPENNRVTIQANIKQCDDGRRYLLADGELAVDGRVIYHMRDYSLRLYEP
jgi:3-hydroxymyristoyl/3-hydroxydecanoyl-(acyl carrier protein) dehydratase